MKIIITTLSIGENYTKDYTLRMIDDVLSLTDIDIYITTDCRYLIDDKFGESDRIKINEVDRKNLMVSLPIGPNKAARDFNFNLRHLCLDHVKNIDDCVVIFTDCDNSLDWWDKDSIIDFISKKFEAGYDYFAPRTDYKFKYAIDRYNSVCKKTPNEDVLDYDTCTILWEKFFNYDLVDIEKKEIVEGLNHKWSEASVPTEYLIIFYNNNGKLKKMVEQWKWFHDYLCNRDYVYGTWAEGFEIGVSCLVGGFNPFDISYHHPIWGKMFTPNGYKTGPRAGQVHATEK
jgi:hypothetical protein